MGHQNRRHWRFWININDPGQEELNRFCEWASEQRKLAQLIRDGLRLMGTLREGRVDVLIEMFPFVLQALTPSVSSEPSRSGDTDKRLERIEQLLLENNQGTTYQMNGIGGAGPKALNVPKISLPAFDDDDDMDTLVIQASTLKVDTAANFLSSLTGLTGKDYSKAN